MLNNPQTIFNDKYKLDKSDFEPILFHKIIFVCIHSLAIKNVKEIDSIVLVEWLKNHEAQFQVFKDNDGEKFIDTIKYLSSDNALDYHYDRVKIFSALRAYKQNGFDISEIYDESNNESEELANIETLTTQKVLDYFDKKQVEIKKRFSAHTNERMVVGEDIDEYLKQTEEAPQVGANLSPLINSLSLGLCQGHLIMRSAPSGLGKTLMGINDIVGISCKRIWSKKKNAYVNNPFYQGKGLIIHCEQKMKTEIQPRILSAISRVPYGTITKNAYSTLDEKERVREAGLIASNSELELLNYPDFTFGGLKEILRDFALNGGKYVFFDYVNDNGLITGEYKRMTGLSQVAEHKVLIAFVNMLKLAAESFNLGIITSSQLNGQEKTNDLIDEKCLRGSQGMKDKLDFGCIVTKPKKKDLAMVQGLTEAYNNQQKNETIKIFPNIISHCYKNRYGEWGQNIRVYSNLNNATGEVTDMFATDEYNNYIEIPKTYIKTNGTMVQK